MADFALSDPWVSNQVTLRDMFRHRSGLPAYAGDDLYASFGYDLPAIAHRLRYLPLATPIRTTFAYANTGISAAVLGLAESRGTDWDSLVQSQLFGPLGMTSSSFTVAGYEATANRARSHYRLASGEWTVGPTAQFDGVAPAGGASASVADLTAWMRLQLATGRYDGQQVVASAPLIETHQPQIIVSLPPNPAQGVPTFYGLAWEIEYDSAGRTLLHHGGDLSDGFRTGVYLLPAAQLGIVVLTNSWPNALRDAIPRAFLELVETGSLSRDWVGEIQTQIEQLLGQLIVAPFPQGAPPADVTPAQPLANYAGTYHQDLYGDIVIAETTDGLTITFGDSPKIFVLAHYADDTFRYQNPGSSSAFFTQFGVIFTVGPAGQALSLQVPSIAQGAPVAFVRQPASADGGA